MGTVDRLARHLGGEPGEVRIVPLEKMMETATSTHHLSLHYMIRFLKEEWDGEAVMVGIQPGSMELGDGVSEAVEAGVDRLAEVLREALGEYPRSGI